jgi:hypothetical protein
MPKPTDMDETNRLRKLVTAARARLETAPPPGTEAAQLIALVCCEPVTGEVLLACWAGDTTLHWELVSPAGTSLSEPNILREVLALAAMTDALEALADATLLGEVADELEAAAAQLAAHGPVADAVMLAAQGARGVALETANTPEQPRAASPARLDLLTTMLRDLATRWQLAEHAAGQVAGEAGAAELLAALARVRARTLAVSPAEAVEAARLRGSALADEAVGSLVVREHGHGG